MIGAGEAGPRHDGGQGPAGGGGRQSAGGRPPGHHGGVQWAEVTSSWQARGVLSIHLPRWILSEQRLRTGRQGFSVVKIPAKKLMKKLLRVPRNRKTLKF